MILLCSPVLQSGKDYMGRIISVILIVAGAAMILVAGGIFAYNRLFDQNAGQAAKELLDQTMEDFGFELPPLGEMVYVPPPKEPDSAPPEETPEQSAAPLIRVSPEKLYVSLDEIPDENEEALTEGDASEPTGEQKYQPPEYTVIGILSIPALGVRLPVIGECTDELLKISCCRLSGVVTDRPNRLVIAGHRISSHFGGLESLSIGDQIAFTNMEGETFYYGLTEITDVDAEGGADVLAATGWDITLLTCKTDRSMRAMVRFAQI